MGPSMDWGARIETEEGEQIGDEGCLSFPGIFLEVKRPQRIVVRALDIDGSEMILDVMDLQARCVSHETDHLDGELFISYISPLKRDLTKRKIKKRIDNILSANLSDLRHALFFQMFIGRRRRID